MSSLGRSTFATNRCLRNTQFRRKRASRPAEIVHQKKNRWQSMTRSKFGISNMENTAQSIALLPVIHTPCVGGILCFQGHFVNDLKSVDEEYGVRFTHIEDNLKRAELWLVVQALLRFTESSGGYLWPLSEALRGWHSMLRVFLDFTATRQDLCTLSSFESIRLSRSMNRSPNSTTSSHQWSFTRHLSHVRKLTGARPEWVLTLARTQTALGLAPLKLTFPQPLDVSSSTPYRLAVK
jgi:hypothetical protein